MDPGGTNIKQFGPVRELQIDIQWNVTGITHWKHRRARLTDDTFYHLQIKH